MNPIRLYHGDGTPTDLYYCSRCRAAYKSEELAEACCRPKLCECGEPVMQYYTTCDSCRNKNWREQATIKEAERFEKATKVSWRDYDGFVYCEQGDSGDSYYPDTDELMDDLCCNDLEGIVTYAWACTSRPIVSVDITNILENCADQAYEDWEHDGSGLAEFVAAIEKFEKDSNTPRNTAWNVDYSRAIILEVIELGDEGTYDE
jgi:hypothetical protein